MRLASENLTSIRCSAATSTSGGASQVQRPSHASIDNRKPNKRYISSYPLTHFGRSLRVRLMTVAGNGAPALGATEDVPKHTEAEPTVMDGISSSKVTGMTFCHLSVAYI